MKRKLNASNAGDQHKQGSNKRQRSTTKKRSKVVSSYTDLWAKLPGEIRNEIYDMVLHSETPILVGNHPGSKHAIFEDGSRAKRWIEPGILRVNKRIRQEALPVYYNENRFKVTIKAENDVRGAEWVIKRFRPEKGKTSQYIKDGRLQIAWTKVHATNVSALYTSAYIIWSLPTDYETPRQKIDSWTNVFDVSTCTGAGICDIIRIAATEELKAIDTFPLKWFSYSFRRWEERYKASKMRSLSIRYAMLDNLSYFKDACVGTPRSTRGFGQLPSP